MRVVQLRNLSKRTISAFLAVLLILTAPGPGAYAVVLKTVVQVSPLGTPAGLVGAVPGAAGAAPISLSQFSPGTGISLGSTLPTVPLASLGDGVLADAGARSAGLLTAPVAAPKPFSSRAVPEALAPEGTRKAPEALSPEGTRVPIIKSVTSAVSRLEKRKSSPKKRSALLSRMFDLTGRTKTRSGMPTAAVAGTWRSARSGLRHDGLNKPAFDPLSVDLPIEPQKPTAKKINTAKVLKLGRNAIFFIAALIFAQLGAEAVGAALPTLIQQSFGDFARTVSHLVILSYVMDIIGRHLAPMTIRRLGLKNTFLAAHGLKLLFMATLAALLGTGLMTLPLLQVFILANSLMGGITATVEQSIPPAMVGRSAAALEHYWTREQAFRSLISIGGPIGTGALVFSFGFLPAFLAFPIATGLALLIVWKLVKILPHLEKAAAKQANTGTEEKSDHPKADKKGLKERLEPFTRGVKLVWKTTALRHSATTMAIFAIAGTLLFVLMIPAYGLLLAGPGMEELATGIFGWIIGLFNLGGLMGVLITMRSQRKLGKRIREQNLSKDEVDELLLRSLLRWFLVGILGLAAMATFAIPLPTLSALIHLPAFLSWAGNITVPALALIPQGFVTVVAGMKLRSFFQSRVPSQDDMPDAMGFLGALTLVAQAVSLFFMKFLFTNFTGYTPFVYASFGVIPIAALLLFMYFKLRGHSRAGLNRLARNVR